MNIFDYVFTYVTENSIRGIVRADNREDAIDRVNDYRSKDRVKYIVCLVDIDNDYGIIEEDTIDKAVKNETMIKKEV